MTLRRRQPGRTASGPAAREAATGPGLPWAPAAAIRLETPVETELGGLFYLLPLAVHLGLYADFTRPAVERGVLDPWDFVTMLGRELGAGTGVGAGDDRVWTLLARLAGREPGSAPGARWHAPRDWRIDPSWLAPMPPADAWTWWGHGRRLRVEHPAGFALVDMASRARTERGARAALARSLPGHAGLPVLTEGPSRIGPRLRPKQRWIAEVAAYVDPRLRLALGIAADVDLAAMLFHHPATIQVSAEAVTVELSLDTLPIEIRIAGLDRDLGWLPAAGRALMFRFS